jgi:NADH:ubiquinone oxidoreductase subunit E
MSPVETKFKLPAQIVAYIEETRKKEHPESQLIAVLQKVQLHFGYLPKECMDEVSWLMQVPAAQVTGVATFYHFFSFVPKGKHRITVCMGTACFVKGAGKVLDRLKELLGIREGQTTRDALFSLECARCLGACALAPVVVVNEKVYGNVKPEDVTKILSEYGYGKKEKAD